MKKFFKALLFIVLGIAVLVGIAAAYVSMRSLPKHTPEKISVKVEYTPERVENGTKLASMLCRNCHLNDETGKFTGRELTEAPQFGKIFAKNITKDPNAGIGKWTDGELIYFLRTGIRPDGVYIPPYMPKLVHISDEDMLSIVAFLRSDNRWVQPDPTEMPESKTSFLTNFLVTIGAAKPFPYPKAPVPGPDTTNAVKHGEYLALYQLECFACHSQDFAKNDYFTPSKSPGFFGGGNKMYRLDGSEIYSLNITPDPNTGIGAWSEDDFVKAVKFGQVPNGKPSLRDPMQPYSNLTDKEAKAIYSYLKSVPKINNKIERKFQEQ
jgi:mono/diheme cytochrome c family protein